MWCRLLQKIKYLQREISMRSRNDQVQWCPWLNNRPPRDLVNQTRTTSTKRLKKWQVRKMQFILSKRPIGTKVTCTMSSNGLLISMSLEKVHWKSVSQTLDSFKTKSSSRRWQFTEVKLKDKEFFSDNFKSLILRTPLCKEMSRLKMALKKKFNK